MHKNKITLLIYKEFKELLKNTEGVSKKIENCAI